MQKNLILHAVGMRSQNQEDKINSNLQPTANKWNVCTSEVAK